MGEMVWCLMNTDVKRQFCGLGIQDINFLLPKGYSDVTTSSKACEASMN